MGARKKLLRVQIAPTDPLQLSNPIRSPFFNGCLEVFRAPASEVDHASSTRKTSISGEASEVDHASGTRKTNLSGEASEVDH